MCIIFLTSFLADYKAIKLDYKELEETFSQKVVEKKVKGA